MGSVADVGFVAVVTEAKAAAAKPEDPAEAVVKPEDPAEAVAKPEDPAEAVAASMAV